MNTPSLFVEKSVTWTKVVEADSGFIYYRSSAGAIRWLQSCHLCGQPGDKWCLQCSSTYCDQDFLKSHHISANQIATKAISREKSGLANIDREDFIFHQWSTKEVPQLQEGDHPCINCLREQPVKLCSVCWDSYCQRCFELVHHIGALKDHKSLNLNRAKLAWYVEPNKDDAKMDQYVNGFTGEARTEKPPELMSDSERVLLQNWTNYRATKEEYSQVVQNLRTELNTALIEKDKVTVEMAKLANQIKQRLEDRKKTGGKR